MASVRKRGNAYQITISNGRDIKGKQIIETTTFTPDPDKTERQNQKALEKFTFEFEERVKEGKYLDGEKLTYKAYVELWFEDYAKKQLQQTSIERCESALNKIILPEIGHLKLSKIQPLHIQNLYNKLSEKGYILNGERKEYNTNTIKRMHQIISSTLNTAVYWQLIESNPCARVKPPKVERNSSDIKHFTLEEAQIFLNQLDKEYTTSSGGRKKRDGSPSERHYETHKLSLQMKVFFYLALFGGFRLGELIALTWEDINFKDNTVSITKSTARTKNGLITKTPKTASSVRTVSIPEDTMKLLKKYKNEQNLLRIALGSAWEGIGHIFIQDIGKQMDISTPNHVFKKIIKRYNASANGSERISEITLHGLRHTSATLLIAQNIDARTVSERLGHSECSTTMNIYAHALKKQDQVAATSLEKLFFKKA